MLSRGDEQSSGELWRTPWKAQGWSCFQQGLAWGPFSPDYPMVLRSAFPRTGVRLTFLEMELFFGSKHKCGCNHWCTCWKHTSRWGESAPGNNIVLLSLGFRVLETAFWQLPFEVFPGCCSLTFGAAQLPKASSEAAQPRLLVACLLQLSFVRAHSCKLNEQCAKPLKTQLQPSLYCRRERRQTQSAGV